MSIRMGRIPFILLVAALAAALIAGCQSAQPQAAKPTQPSGNTQATNAYPGGSNSVSIPQVQAGYPAQGQQAAAAQPAPTNYPAPQNNAAGGAPAGAPALPNQANVVAEFMEQKAGPNADQVILHVKLVSATPAAGSTDFVTQLIGKEMDLVASSAGLPQLAKGDQFTAVVSLQGDETNRQYSADKIEKK